jgi:hypothetical protein
MAKVGELDIKTTPDELEMKAGVDELLNRRAAVGLAVGVVRNGSLDICSLTLAGSQRSYTRPICSGGSSAKP